MEWGTSFGHGPLGWLAMLLFSALAHEPWRWAGYLLGRRLNPDDAFFQWVRYVSTALIAALVARLILFPSGALGHVALEIRVVALVAGVGLYFVTNKIWQGVLLTAIIIGIGKYVLG